ncbi:MAG: hypothetical protein JWR80_5992 [Bradyrhizobium sp.]|nr:hypothetical protein [Bradyrhizobium sp.]
MADRVPASIRIGGALSRIHLPTLIAEIEAAALVDALGDLFRLDHITGAEPLELYANEVTWGRFEDLEAFCVIHRLPFARWSGSYPGSFEAERVIFDGASDPRYYTVTENDVVVVTAAEVRSLGSFDAVLGYLASADPELPPLIILAANEEASNG